MMRQLWRYFDTANNPSKKGSQQLNDHGFPLKNVFLIVGIPAGIAVVAYLIFPSYQSLIIFAASCAGGFGAVGGAFYLAWGLILTAEEQRRNRERRRIENAFRYMERWNAPQFYHVRKVSREVLRINETKGPQAVTAELEQDESCRMNMMDAMNFLEEMAMAIDLGIVNEEMLKRGFRGIVHAYWLASEDFFTRRRQKLSSPRILIEVEELHKRWI